MFNSINDLLNYIRSNDSQMEITYDITNGTLLVVNNTTNQVLFNQSLNYELGEFKTSIEPLFTHLNCDVIYVRDALT
ncbi:hypothetical protein [Candidatus Arthromitus sp. SFB-rat-Yit]|uniref:hypothetical protein n=1 Tax=Candidatus Arthromitus sp. SFB-rat-Yit TaxID=1041504 RepID=UPI0002D742D0|nr:hypothetical protein [Candidatus Arthromitus sp. SFB-rat-Yit]